MVGSLIRDIIHTVFGFLIVFQKLFKNPLGMHEIAKSGNGFRLGLSILMWVLAFDIWVGNSMIEYVNNYDFSSSANSELLIDFGESATIKSNSKEEYFLGLVSLPLIKELFVFIRLLVALIVLIPVSLFLLGKQKNEADFRNFIGLNFLLSSFSAFIFIVLIAIVFHILILTSSYQLLSLMYFIQAIISILVGIPMMIVIYKNWRNMLPHSKKWRMNLAFFIWLLGGAVITGIFKMVLNY